MDSYQQSMKEEAAYLEKTLAFIRKELGTEGEALADRKSKLIATRKDMWENTAHFSNDFDRLVEMNQHLTEVNNQTSTYDSTRKRVEKYKRALGSPYFGRFDFVEEGTDDNQMVYIGLYNIMDSKTCDIYVYDWRAPISSIFYRYELGTALYDTPDGMVSGDVLLKRQYKIQDSRLKYFFDSSVRINDEILQNVLSHNSSVKMRNIVETIQKEQDIIIRDTDNELLIVQGVAGSGKTSIALHRIAFLMYEGMNSSLDFNNIIIISPNAVFSKYISSVLPELGEENVEQTTFDQIALKLLGNRVKAETRNTQLELLISSDNKIETDLRRKCIEFKGSKAFMHILDRFLLHYERHMIAFEDVYFDGKLLETRQKLKGIFLDNKIGMPMAKRLGRIENMILEKIHPLQRKRLEKIEKTVEEEQGHEFEIKSYSRLLSMKEAKKFMDRLHRFTEVDYFNIYKVLFGDKELFLRLAEGLELPEDIEKIISVSHESLRKEHPHYEDCAPLIYLKLKLEGSDLFPEIRQVVIDEAQDYYSLQYEVFKLLFKDARYTVLGDFHQAIERNADKSVFDRAVEILDKKKAVKLFLNKSYRSSFEINMFNQKLLDSKQDFVSFERHEEEPMVVFKDTRELMDEAVAHDIARYLEKGYESIAVICKTQQEAVKVQARLRNLVKVKLLNASDGEIEKGALVISSYMAKGLEFDAVIVYGADKENYSSRFDKKLLYIACTRALHHLVLYHTGEKSVFL